MHRCIFNAIITLLFDTIIILTVFLGHSDLSVATAFCLALFSHIVNGTTCRLLQSLYELRSEELESKNSGM